MKIKCPQCGGRARKRKKKKTDSVFVQYRIKCRKCGNLVIRAWVLFPNEVIEKIEFLPMKRI